MDGHSFRYPPRRVLTAAALALTLAGTAPAVADEPTPQWLSAFGEFVRDGLAPPRLAEDVLREERQQKEQPPAPVHVAAPQPVPQPAPLPVPAAAITPEPVAVPAPPVPPKAPAAMVKKAVPSVQPSPRAVVVPAEIKPRPVVPVAVQPVAVQPVPLAPLEPLTGSRIAATASLDQAIKLGGAATLYGPRVKK